MKFVYKGKYSGNEDELPHREHPENYHAYKEPESIKKLAVIANALSLIIYFALFAALIMLTSFKEVFYTHYLSFCFGVGAAALSVIPHEFLHAVCFKDEVQMYQNLRHAMLFVIGVEDMSKPRFIFMSLLPNIVFGLIPFIIFLINPSLIFFGSLGALGLASGAGDYINVFNTIVQVPKNAKIYMSGMHTYWYK